MAKRKIANAAFALGVIKVLYDDEEEEEQQQLCAIGQSVGEEALKIKRDHKRQTDPRATHQKRVHIVYDRERARKAVYEDYFGPYPTFNDRQFERVFRITQQIAELIIQTCMINDGFYRESKDAAKRKSICPKVKVLMGLKLLAYGVSASAFVDYFQMGISTGRECLKHLCFVLSTDEVLLQKYFRQMNRLDAIRVSDLHNEKHGVEGMIGSLDCMHVGWKNCPMAWQGHFQGKEKSPTIVLEAFADYNLWIWHAAFGYAGSLNDINIWEQSPLLKSFVDGTFTKEVDFDFTINNTTFNRCWLLVDGIYPELARFVKTIDEPRGKGMRIFASWQEASRKDIERAFGVIQRKFQILKREVEQWFLCDIKRIVQTTIILHNMMVEHRIENNELESEGFYEVDDNHSVNQKCDDVDEEILDREAAEVEINYRMEKAYYHGSAVNIVGKEQENLKKWFSHHQQVALRRWEVLYNPQKHFELRKNIIEQLLYQYEEHNAGKK